jgi:predicted transcriptional regulator
LRQEKKIYFTDREEKFTDVLIKTGIPKNVAKVLTFFVKSPEATSRAIEDGTGLRQPEVNKALRHLVEKGLIIHQRSSTGNRGRPEKIYVLTKAVDKIWDTIFYSYIHPAENER